MKQIGDEIEYEVFCSKPELTLPYKYHGAWLVLNRGLMHKVWVTVGMKVDEDKDSETKIQWYNT